MIRFLYLAFAVVVTAIAAWINGAVHSVTPFGTAAEQRNIRAQLRHLEPLVHSGLARDMQRLYPEGEVFTYALYALGWCGLAARLPTEDSLRTHALAEATWAYRQLDTDAARQRFPISTSPEYGVFYAGWRTHVLGNIVLLGSSDSVLRNAFDHHSAAIAHAFASSSTPYLESYSGTAWPADALMALSSLRLHERATGADHSAVIARWVDQARDRLDGTGMVPHAWYPVKNTVRQPARGSSMALMLTVLPSVDSAFAAEQYLRFRDRYFQERFGVPGVREHPIGDGSPGDVDSGPLVMGFGPVATIVGSAACRANGDPLHAAEFEATVNGFGSVTGGAQRRYLFGALPIADLFITWARCTTSAVPLTAPPLFRRFHVWSALFIMLVWSPWVVRWWRRR